LERCGIQDRFLDRFSKETRITIFSAFIGSLRRNEDGEHNKTNLRGSTITSTVNLVCATFRSNLRDDLTVDASGTRVLVIHRQLRGYNKADGAVAHQKCLPLLIFKKIWQNSMTPKEMALGELIVDALFFGMRSCEYSIVKGERKTKLLRLRNLKFLQRNKSLFKIKGNRKLLTASSICIAFESQKNGDKDQTITMHANKTSICPVRALACLTLRILNYPGASLELPVNTYKINNTIDILPSTEILRHIRATVDVIGIDVLGFNSKDVGCHSIRSSFAMFLYKQDVRTDKIMLQGRWRSDAFLLYIRVQITAFSTGISHATIKDSNNFYTVPDTHVSQKNNSHRSPMFNFNIVTNPAYPRCRNASTRCV